MSLHSTMSLLLRCLIAILLDRKQLYIPLCLYYYKFTETYVASGLYLYIPLCLYYYIFNTIDQTQITTFTFHYVSITTSRKYAADKINTMFFTFHYVSITTEEAKEKISKANSFTFHYVSITTARKQRLTCSTKLYIPLCLYYY